MSMPSSPDSADSARLLGESLLRSNSQNYGVIGCKGMGWSNMNAPS